MCLKFAVSCRGLADKLPGVGRRTLPTEIYKRAAQVARHTELIDLRLSSVASDLIDGTHGDIDHGVSVASRHQYSHDEDAGLVNVFIDFIVRVRRSDDDGEESDEDADRLAWGMKCTFEIAYGFRVENGPQGEELDEYLEAFAEVNGIYNAWPYLRELVQSTAQRMGLRVTVPSYKVERQESSGVSLEASGDEANQIEAPRSND